MRASGPTAVRSWGWHALTDQWAAKVVAAAGIRPGDLVLDLGAGKGAVTARLLDAGARVLAVELHPGRAEFLRRRFGSAAVTVVQADLASLLLPHRPFKVVANPPFDGSAQLMRVLLGRGSRLLSADLVLQRAVVSKLLSVHYARWRVVESCHLPRSAFQPRPRVDASVLRVSRG